MVSKNQVINAHAIPANVVSWWLDPNEPTSPPWLRRVFRTAASILRSSPPNRDRTAI